jgi:hypothetical protein
MPGFSLARLWPKKRSPAKDAPSTADKQSSQAAAAAVAVVATTADAAAAAPAAQKTKASRSKTSKVCQWGIGREEGVAEAGERGARGGRVALEPRSLFLPGGLAFPLAPPPPVFLLTAAGDGWAGPASPTHALGSCAPAWVTSTWERRAAWARPPGRTPWRSSGGAAAAIGRLAAPARGGA